MLFQIAFFASLLRSITSVSGTGATDLDRASVIIHKDVQSYYSDVASGRDQCDYTTCCNLSETEECSLSGLTKDETTLVFPGGETRCINSYSTPFSFQVIPGASDKVVFYFQGGGACWDELSTKLGFCSSDASPSSLSGIFDRTNEANDFKEHTIVQVLYCSGDVHGGNTVRPYNDRDGVPVEQKGLANAQSALDWVVKQQAEGNLAATLSELVVMGCSAGSVGAQLWGKQVLSALKWEKAAVVPDSYAGVFPEGTQGPLIYEYGFCKSGFLSEELTAKCNAKELTLLEIDLEFIAATPNVPYSFIQSKIDSVQMSFYIAVGITMNATGNMMTNPTEFYEGVNEIFGTYNSKLSNFVTYLVDGPHHCFTNQGLYYDADAMGPHDAGKTNSGDMLHEWTNYLPLADGEHIDSVCEGDVQQQPGATTTTTATTTGPEKNTYCSADVIPKQYTQQY
mmetsp:Transcript_31921/g.53350  ORF Transcript_31921/g.53350 Transcript_31921/m.53350 type:complete len:453 (-) Transcript_31921:262-1620(-)